MRPCYLKRRLRNRQSTTTQDQALDLAKLILLTRTILMVLTSTSYISWLRITSHLRSNRPTKSSQKAYKLMEIWPTFQNKLCKKINKLRLRDSKTSSKVSIRKRMESQLKMLTEWDTMDLHPAVAVVKIKIAYNRTSKFWTCQWINLINKWHQATSKCSKMIWKTCWPIYKEPRIKFLKLLRLICSKIF